MSIKLKQLKLETIQDTTKWIEKIIEEVNKNELSKEQVAELIKSIINVYNLVLDPEDMNEILDIFLED